MPRRIRGSQESADQAAVQALRQATDNAGHAEPSAEIGVRVVGQSGSGCTRLAWQAMKAVPTLADWTFVDWPATPVNYPDLFDQLEQRHAKVIVWLDNLTKYAESADPSATVGLPANLRAKKIPFVIVATCSGNEARRRAVGERLNLLWDRLAEIQPGDLTPIEAQTLASELTESSRKVQLEGALDGRPGTIVMAVNGMGKEKYNDLPLSAKLILRAIKLLRSIGIHEYTIERVSGTAADTFGFSPLDWQASFSALEGMGYLKMGSLTLAGKPTVEPEAEVYLDLAVPDYTGREEASGDWPKLQASLVTRRDGIGLARLGNAFRIRENLLPSEQCYREALTLLTRDQSARDWAIAQYGLGLVLARRIEDAAVPERELMVQAEECFRSAFTVITRESDPSVWAGGQRALASVLRQEAPSTQRPARPAVVQNAIQAARQALRVLSRESAPEEWAETHLSLGLVLLIQAPMDPNLDAARTTLDRAIDSCRKALSVFTKEDSPVWWARAQRGLAESCSERAARANRSYRMRLLSEAVPAYRNALSVSIPEQAAADHALLYARLGNALRNLGSLQDGMDRVRLFEEAVRAYSLAVSEYNDETTATDRVETQRQLGQLLTDLAEQSAPSDKSSLASQAIVAYEDALAVMGRRGSVQDRDDIRTRLGHLYLVRATALASSDQKTAYSDAKRGLGYIDTALGHTTESSDPVRYRQVQRVRKDLQTMARELEPTNL